MSNKRVYLIFVIIFLLIFIPIVQAVQVVEVQQQPVVPEKKGIFASAWDFIKSIITSPIFWGALVFLVLFIVIAIIIYYVVKAIIKYFKEQKDVFYLMRNDRIRMAKIHRRYSSTHWWKVQKNAPIRLARKEGDNLIVSRPIAFHRGDYTTHEGNINISLNFRDKKKLYFFPETDLLIIPNRDIVKMKKKLSDNHEETVIIKNIPTAKEIVRFNEDEILIFADSLSQVGRFFIPVLKTEDNKIIDLSLPVYHTLKEAMVDDYLYTQSSDFVTYSRKAVDMNPNVRINQKLADNNQNVEVETPKEQ
jgi:hypothetical protein